MQPLTSEEQAPAGSQESLPDDVFISVRNVGKAYRLYERPQDRLKHSLFWRFGRSYGREFWALRNISFDVRRGDTLGIIGRNGSGKSTLLQIIAGTLSPTTGQVFTRGRIAAVLELGSGFNPEFTGRENVYINGAILGLSREEVDARFDEIAGFADIGDFIDQPVRLYSSGMFVRLAFAVMTTVDPDILLVDEALAVGDVFFRQKCYRRLETLREKGVPILLVSHSMSDIEQYCRRGLLLSQGDLLFQGTASEAVKHYYLVEQAAWRPPAARISHVARHVLPSTETLQPPDNSKVPPAEAFIDIADIVQVSNGVARCTGIAICNTRDEPCRVFQQGETARFFYEFEVVDDLEVPIGGLVIQNDKGVIVHGKNTLEYGSEVPLVVKRDSKLRFTQNIALEIAAGAYTFEVGLAAIAGDDYESRAAYTHSELDSHVWRLCHLPVAGRFDVVFRRDGSPVQLLHHGAANLKGQCQVAVVGPDSHLQ